MKPPEEIQRDLVLQWIRKADEDFAAALQLLKGEGRFRGVIAFHCQQTVEKYLKAYMVRHQIDFPKTHDIGRLLTGIAAIDLALYTALQEADVLTPFGVEIRYPSDAPELLPGQESEAMEIARRTRDAVMSALAPYLSERDCSADGPTPTAPPPSP